jgi:hypothetical protein
LNELRRRWFRKRKLGEPRKKGPAFQRLKATSLSATTRTGRKLKAHGAKSVSGNPKEAIPWLVAINLPGLAKPRKPNN